MIYLIQLTNLVVNWHGQALGDLMCLVMTHDMYTSYLSWTIDEYLIEEEFGWVFPLVEFFSCSLT